LIPTIVTYTIKNRPEQVRDAFKQYENQMCISAVTRGELIYGAERSSQPERSLADIEGLIACLEVAPFEEHASEYFGKLNCVEEWNRYLSSLKLKH